MSSLFRQAWHHIDRWKQSSVFSRHLARFKYSILMNDRPQQFVAFHGVDTSRFCLTQICSLAHVLYIQRIKSHAMHAMQSFSESGARKAFTK